MRPLAGLLLCACLLAQDGDARWKRMLRSDADGDGRISRAEYPGPRHRFESLDQNQDGFVTRSELAPPRTDVPSFRVDLDRDGKVSAEEWSRFYRTADLNLDGVLEDAELDAALKGLPYPDRAPKAGAAAPAVRAKQAGPAGEPVDLARPKRPTVLVFGSWT